MGVVKRVRIFHCFVTPQDWKRSTKPELNDASNYYTPLSLMVLSPINELVSRLEIA